MEILAMDLLNASPILLDLQAKIQAFDVSESLYLRSFSDQDLVHSSDAKHPVNALGIKEEHLPKILQLLGVRSLTLNAQHDLSALANLNVEIPENAASEQHQWYYLRSEAVITELALLLLNCRTIAFDDWSKVAAASDLWDGLLTDVIHPLGKTNLEFIFYLGDLQHKLSFEVDEALDIISGFSRHGQVTLALDEKEAINLWMVLNGVHPDTPTTKQSYPDLKKKYFSIFRTMRITRLLIYSAYDTLLFTSQKQFVLARKRVAPNVELAPEARQNFIAGFSFGMLLRLDIAHCIALGLIVFGSYGEVETSPAPEDLLAYIDRWQEDLQKPDSIHLYD
ncbi:hypothetical protein [Hymenobacter volaticus]|uniref:Uncharacterized protein n=1 Tax=Hymenobacter volaticus TaxID=2932254 RepID=A0ABY4GF14_9BACT|nr:hypothetical protein [Hymenobacter volaticus]UOQ69437.1 hypothetical protein MUN86_28550 [Hymenobacter volaticus]